MQEDPMTLEELTATWIEEKNGDSKATTIICSVMAIISLIASSVLIWMIKRSYTALTTTYHRILLGMSISDIFFSLALATFNFTSPSDSDYYVWNARGNQGTCDAQGFVWFAGLSCGMLYCCSLSLYSLAVVKYKKSDEFIRSKIEPFLHGFPIAFGLVIDIILLVKKTFNIKGMLCYPGVYNPPHCIGYENGQTRKGFTIPCGRGSDGALLLSNIVFVILFFAVPLIVGTSIAMIYRDVLQQERMMASYGAGDFTARGQQPSGPQPNASDSDERLNDKSWMDRWMDRLRSFRRFSTSAASTSNQNKSRSRAVLHRAIAYSFSYFLTFTWPFLFICFGLANTQPPSSIRYLFMIFNPLLGLFNFFIFIYPRMANAKSRAAKSRAESNISWFQAFGIALWSRGYNPSAGRTSVTRQSSTN